MLAIFLSFPGFHANMACRYRRPYDIVPFAFRTHAHSTGKCSLKTLFVQLIHHFGKTRILVLIEQQRSILRFSHLFLPQKLFSLKMSKYCDVNRL